MSEFSLVGFANHLARVSVELIVAEHEALERAAVIVETEAKASVGTYQGQSGPFAEWEELAQSTQEERSRLGYPDNEPELRTGEMRDSIEHKVVGREAHIGSDSQILEWQELGTTKMPARSILGGAAYRKTPEVVKEIGEDVVAALIGAEVVGRRLRID